jgi:hypothetical protein
MTIQEANKEGLTTATTWREYVEMTAEEYDVDIDDAQLAFDMLGATEAFDGYLTTLEDMADGIGYGW